MAPQRADEITTTDMAVRTTTMKRNPSNQAVAETFRNPETRERWQWVQRAIGFAEDDSRRRLECRFAEQTLAAASPFVEE